MNGLKTLNIKVAFFKASEGTMFSKLIAKKTKSKYSHAELIVDDKWIYALTSGIGINKLRPLDHKDWDYLDLSVTITEEQYIKFWNFVNKQLGKKYDWLGILFTQTIKIGAQDNDKWFCSELVARLLQILCIEEFWDLNPEDVSPEVAYQLVSKHNLSEKERS